ncbi:MAG: adenosine kinase [Pseudomonadales bacterium]
MSKYDIYGIGAALVDTEIEVSDDFLQSAGVEKGVMTLVDEARQFELLEHLHAHIEDSRRASGGSACNSIIASSYFGSKAFYSCKVAADDNGSFYLSDLNDAGVGHNKNANEAQGITGKCLVMITPDAERSMNTFLGISEHLSDAELDEQALLDSQYVYIEGYLVTSSTGRAAAVKARELAEANGVKTALSLSDPFLVDSFQEGLREMLGSKVDLLFCNEAEAMSWAGTDTLDQAVDSLLNDASLVAVTCGAEGALICDSQQRLKIAPNTVKAVDTNGAGDMFAGAFLHALCAGWSLQQAGDLASLASARVVSGFGPRLDAAEHAEILAAIK